MDGIPHVRLWGQHIVSFISFDESVGAVALKPIGVMKKLFVPNLPTLGALTLWFSNRPIVRVCHAPAAPADKVEARPIVRRKAIPRCIALAGTEPQVTSVACVASIHIFDARLTLCGEIRFACASAAARLTKTENEPEGSVHGATPWPSAIIAEPPGVPTIA